MFAADVEHTSQQDSRSSNASTSSAVVAVPLHGGPQQQQQPPPLAMLAPLHLDQPPTSSQHWHVEDPTFAPFVPRLNTLALLAAGAPAPRGAQTDRHDQQAMSEADCAAERLALLIEAASALNPPRLEWSDPLATARSVAAYVPEFPFVCDMPADPLYQPTPQLPLSVFIGNIPPNTTPNSLLRLVTQRGAVTEILCDFRPDAWLTAFVTFARPADAQRAVESLNNRRALRTSRPHRLVCCFAPPSPASLGCLPPDDSDCGEAALAPFFPKFAAGELGMQPPSNTTPRFSLLKDGPPGANLFLYGIPSDWTEVTLLRLCQEHGHVVGLRVPRAVSHGGGLMQRLNKGFGFVSYDNVSSSARALAALNGRRFLSKPLNVQLKTGESLPPEAEMQLRNHHAQLQQQNSPHGQAYAQQMVTQAHHHHHSQIPQQAMLHHHQQQPLHNHHQQQHSAVLLHPQAQMLPHGNSLQQQQLPPPQLSNNCSDIAPLLTPSSSASTTTTALPQGQISSSTNTTTAAGSTPSPTSGKGTPLMQPQPPSLSVNSLCSTAAPLCVNGE